MCAAATPPLLRLWMVLSVTAATTVVVNKDGWWRPGAQYTGTMSLTALVQTRDRNQSTGSLRAFVGRETRGNGSATLTPTFGPFQNVSLFLMMLYGDECGETIRFEHVQWDGRGLAATTTTTLVETVTFKANDIVGNALSPFVLTDS